MGYVSAAMSVIGAVSSASASNANARTSQAWANYNYSNTISAANYNAQMTTAMAELNASMMIEGAKLSSSSQKAIAQYNAGISVLLAEKDASLLEEQADRVWEAADLDVMQRDQQGRKSMGDMTVKYAANGVQINVAGDAPQSALLLEETQMELDKFIIRHGADIEASKLLDSAAMSRWNGQQAADSIIYEAEIFSIGTMAQAYLNAGGAIAQGNIDASSIKQTGWNSANDILYQGNFTASQYRQQGNQQMFQGLVQGATTASSTYFDNKTANPGAGVRSPALSSGLLANNTNEYTVQSASGEYEWMGV